MPKIQKPNTQAQKSQKPKNPIIPKIPFKKTILFNPKNQIKNTKNLKIQSFQKSKTKSPKKPKSTKPNTQYHPKKPFQHHTNKPNTKQPKKPKNPTNTFQKHTKLKKSQKTKKPKKSISNTDTQIYIWLKTQTPQSNQNLQQIFFINETRAIDSSLLLFGFFLWVSGATSYSYPFDTHFWSFCLWHCFFL